MLAEGVADPWSGGALPVVRRPPVIFGLLTESQPSSLYVAPILNSRLHALEQAACLHTVH